MNNTTTHSENLGLLFEALSKAQGKIENVLKDKKNTFFNYSYADLSSVWDACREHTSSNGLAVIQTVEGTKEEMFLSTWIGHSSGQWMKSNLPLTILPEQRKDKNGNVVSQVITPQAIGSAITYARRYALSALVGICCDEDDDGEKSMARNNQKINKTKDIEIQLESDEQKEKKLNEFILSYPKEDHELIRSYIDKYCDHWTKTISQALKDFENKEQFNSDFSKWKKKNAAKVAA